MIVGTNIGIAYYNNTNTFQVPTDIMSQLSVFAKQIFNTHQDDNILLITVLLS